MTDLEEAICEGVREAQRRYEEINGWWLHHAPESFLSAVMGMTLHAKLQRSVYFDTGLRRIAVERESDPKYKTPRGRAAKVPALRPDLSVWEKTSLEIRAAIEVKRAYGNSLIVKDVEKLRKMVGKSFGPKRGYVLGYTITKAQSTLKKRFMGWRNQPGLRLVKKEIGNTDDDGNILGFALLRVLPVGKRQRGLR